MPSTALDDGNIMYNTIFILHKGNTFLNHDISKFKFHYCAIVSIYTLLILFFFFFRTKGAIFSDFFIEKRFQTNKIVFILYTCLCILKNYNFSEYYFIQIFSESFRFKS